MTPIADPRSAMFIEERPWGTFEQFCLNEPTTVKIITVQPGQRLSLQTHSTRAEFWRILDGSLDVTVAQETQRASAGASFWIPVGTAHRLSNPTATPGRVLEIAFGNFDEGDIERLHDDHGR